METTQIKTENVITKAESFISSDLDEAVVMMDIEKGLYYSLNAVGAEIWEMIENPIAVKTICYNLSSEFDVDEEKCESEVITYLKKLLDFNIISIE